MKKSKVVVIGIDGLEPNLVEAWIDYLPNLKLIKERGVVTSMQSTFPPDSICAWSSIFTGQNPAEHGLLESIDYLSRKKYRYAQGHDFSQDSFWDAASRLGKKVCIINPFLAYPAWKVNGIMISGPVFEGGNTTSSPVQIIKEVNFPSLGGWVDFPEEKNLGEFIEKASQNTASLAVAAGELYRKYPSDLFFLTFLTLDRVEHFLWRFMDEGDPTYPGKSPHRDSIKNFYILLDKIIGHFLTNKEEDSYLMVISDHGHKRRPLKLFNLNEFLRQKGYLFTHTSGVKGRARKIVEKVKVMALNKLANIRKQDFIFKMIKLIPNKKALKKASYLINKEESLALTWDLCGTNSLGGVKIKNGKDYEKLREKAIEDLRRVNSELEDEIFSWVKKREQIYTGQFLGKYPDIIFELSQKYGVGWNLFGDLIGKDYVHKKISGGHSQKGVLAILGPRDIAQDEIPKTVVEVKEFILKLLQL